MRPALMPFVRSGPRPRVGERCGQLNFNLCIKQFAKVFSGAFNYVELISQNSVSAKRGNGARARARTRKRGKIKREEKARSGRIARLKHPRERLRAYPTPRVRVPPASVYGCILLERLVFRVSRRGRFVQRDDDASALRARASFERHFRRSRV